MSVAYAEVIGDPVAHSKSPLIHNHWLAKTNTPADYRARKVGDDELKRYLRSRGGESDWLGCNVTIPHKEAAFRLVDRCSHEANAVGAVNCIVPRGGELVGFNTDIDGIAAALEGMPLSDRTIVVLGGGGAARAALAYLREQQVRAIHVLVRDPERAGKLGEMASAGILTIGSFSQAPDLLAGASLIINATPLGMAGHPQMPESLLVAIAAQRQAVLFDMVYEPIRTEFLSRGKLQRIDGLSMLVGQARRAFELFFGVSPPSADRELRALLFGAAPAG